MSVNEAPAATPGFSEDLAGDSWRTEMLRAPRVRRASKDDWAQLVRFLVVGGSGTLVNLAVFWAVTTPGFVGMHHIPAAVVAFCVAWASNFVLNKFWTFRRHRLPPLQQGTRYLIVSLVGLGLNLSILHGLVLAGVPEIPAQALAIAAVTPVNFLVNRRWSFR